MTIKIKAFLLLIFLVIGCKTDYFYRDNNSIVVYRFLYLNNYGIPINEKSFWENGKKSNEFAIHAIQGISANNMIGFINSLKRIESGRQFSFHYAFLLSNGDTIYSNYYLNNWILKNKSKMAFYSGPNIESPKADTLFCNLFSNDKFFSDLKYKKYPVKEKDE